MPPEDEALSRAAPTLTAAELAIGLVTASVAVDDDGMGTMIDAIGAQPGELLNVIALTTAIATTALNALEAAGGPNVFDFLSGLSTMLTPPTAVEG